MKKALLFDLDGTLLDTLADLHCSVNFALRAQGLPERSLEEIRSFLGNGMRCLIRLSLPQDAGEELIDRTLAQMKAHYADHCAVLTRPYEGILPLLQQLKAQGYPLAIVSNKADPMVQSLRQRYFGDLVDFALGERPGCPRKPEPQMVRQALAQLGRGPEEGIYIGDSEVDLQTARKAALPCLLVTWGFRSRRELEQLQAGRLCDSAEQLQQAIESLTA